MPERRGQSWKRLQIYLTSNKCALRFGASWLILGSRVAECLTASSTVTGRLCFQVSAGDDRLRRARAVPVCPGNVFVFILCLRETFLSFSPSVPKKKEREKKKVQDVMRACARSTHAMKPLPGEA